MACLRPRYATQDQYGAVTLRESRLEATLEDGDYLEIPCRSCGTCRAVRVRGWAIRSHHESLTHTRRVAGGDVDVPNGCFITLTYSENNLPEYSSLQVADLQNFLKKIRRDIGPVRYLACGEYGTSGTKRPHYHLCLFGADFHKDRVQFAQEGRNITWISKQLEETWGRGFAMLAPLNFATASYVAGYVMKKAKTSQHEREFGFIKPDLTPFVKKQEFVTMSRKPGLGTDYFKKFWREIYPRDTVRIEGKEYRPPKFYDDLLLLHDPVLYDQVIAKRKTWLEKQPPTTEQELKARQRNFQARMATKKERM